MPLPFEQQPRESAKAFAAFSLYLSLGAERSTGRGGTEVSKECDDACAAVVGKI